MTLVCGEGLVDLFAEAGQGGAMPAWIAAGIKTLGR